MGAKSGNPQWRNFPDLSTPVDAEALENIEDALDDLENGKADLVDGKVPLHQLPPMSTGGGGGPSTWGQIDGNLADQTDLAGALAGKVSGNAGAVRIERYATFAALPNPGVANVIYFVDSV